jgi:hypothetical protein
MCFINKIIELQSSYKLDADTKSLIFNVIGGIIVYILTTICVRAIPRLRSYHLQRLLGFHFEKNTEMRMVYSQFLLSPSNNNSENLNYYGRSGFSGSPSPINRSSNHPYIKTSRHSGIPISQSQSIAHPISEHEVCASTYIAALLGFSGRLRPLLVSDIEANSLLDSNFISFGGPGSNYKTADILESEANIFIQMENSIFSLFQGENLPFTYSDEADYGCILRITPPGFPARSWIVCAGLGEWGTSGSSWFLANKWQELIKKIHPVAYWSYIRDVPDFMAIIRVRPGQDQSARMVALYRNDRGQRKTIIHPVGN